MKRVFSILIAAIILSGITSCDKEDEGEKDIAVTGIRLDQTGPVTLAVNQSLVLIATVEPSNATNKDIVWSNEPFGIVIMNGGMITGLSPGTATVTVTAVDGGISNSIEITVTPAVLPFVPLVGFAIEEESLDLVPGQTATLTCIFEPADATNKTVMWDSSDPGVASVNAATGEITGVSVGTALITATTAEGSMTDFCTVNVALPEAEITGMTLNKDVLLLSQSAKETLTCTITPPEAPQKVTWSSSSPAIASVNAITGEVTAFSPGKAIITATSANGAHSATCTVMVPDMANLQANLLNNPGFESPDDGTATPVQGWIILEQEWLNTYYTGNTNPITANVGRYGPGMDDAFFNGGNGSFFTPYITEKYVFRITANNSGGAYQVVPVTPGSVYFISIDAGLRRQGNVQAIREDESLKIVRNKIGAKEDVLIYEVPFPVVNNGTDLQEEVFIGQSGLFIAPDDVTEVRFLFDKRNGDPNEGVTQTGLYMWDNCKFQKAPVPGE